MRLPSQNLISLARVARPWLALAALSLVTTACASRMTPVSLAPSTPESVAEACAATSFRPWQTLTGNGARRTVSVAIRAEDNTYDGWSHLGTRRLEGVLSAWNRVNLPVRLAPSADWAQADIRVLIVRRLDEDPGSPNTLASYQAGVTRADISADGFLQKAFVAIGETSPKGTPYSVSEQLGTLQHEIGHALGLPHALETGALMSSVMIATELTYLDARFAKAVYASKECRQPAGAVAATARPTGTRGPY